MTRVSQWISVVVLGATLWATRVEAQATTANPHEASIGACSRCHLPNAWRPVRIAANYRHAEQTFPLDGAHATASCTTCHTSLQFSKAPTQCASCHKDVHRAELGVNCAKCHTTRAFSDQTRLARMHEETRFPLRGAHVATACLSCHPATAAGQAQFSGRPTACVGCHRPDYDKTTSPAHTAATFSTTCTNCHTSNTTWKAANFNHSTTQFPLAGAHLSATCASCHSDGVFKGKATTCVSCHRPDYDRATNSPPHASAGFSTTCTSCHASNTTWKGAAFNHSTTQFPLTGAHQAATCASCHADKVFKGKSTTCVSCHRPDYDRPTNSPPHASAGFSTTCTSCHTSRTTWQGASFNHSTTQFPLAGAHLTAICASCHADKVFKGKSTSCVSCHRPDYDRPTNSPPHAAAGFSTTCTTCHTSNTSWKGAAFNHSTTQFPLTGAHLTVACATCHADGVFRGKPTTCISCHRPNYDRTTSPAHAAAGYSTDCTTCHTSRTTWQGANFNHSTTQFPLTGAHLTVSCISCHADGVYRGKPTTCISCHRADYDRPTNTPPHAAAGYGTDCTTCHTSRTTWRGASFNHSATQFPLTGAHLTVSCISCHADGVYRGKPTTCISCHRPDYDRTTTPAHAAAGYGTDCTTCHTSRTTWSGASFNHSATQFPLTGAHLTVSCISCHADGVYRGKPTTCISCHRADYDRPTNTPPHAAAGYGTDCTTCHTSRTTWSGASFNHSTTQFPLTGAHLTVSCISCHADGVYRGKPTTCISCHRADYDRPTNTPPHAAAGYGTDCTTCHTSRTTWSGATFNHSTTQFPLTGAHLTVSCISCHADGVYRGKPTTCISCHRPDYDRTTTPAHATVGYSTDCTTCHTSRTTWQGATFNHSTTQFPLTGAHLAASCISCHADGVYRGKPTACVSCHRPDYDLPTNTPPHAAAGFSTTCTTCHTSRTTWSGGTFNHTTTQFPLTGAHLAASCLSCHADGVYRGKPTACVSCHRPDYDLPTNTPPHAAAGFSTDCTTCHTSRTTWNGGTFNHSITQFPLTGAHLAASCISCHADGVYRGKPTTCISCHRPDYDQTRTPAHAAAGYSTDCTTCHTSRTTWLGATFNHSTTQFPLTGAHLAVSCISCHADGVYRGKPTACVSCHRADYDLPTNTPPHAAAGFSTTCTTCHTSTTTWAGGTFNHSTTLFPLTGRHLTASCASCHSNGVYRGKSTLCASCHQTDFNRTTNPNHVTARFPTTCATCHTTATWIGARFDHDAPYFPIYSGAHAGRWATCASCHTTPGSYTVYACIACHRQSSTDSDHRSVSNYRYVSTACYSCHPRGNH